MTRESLQRVLERRRSARKAKVSPTKKKLKQDHSGKNGEEARKKQLASPITTKTGNVKSKAAATTKSTATAHHHQPIVTKPLKNAPKPSFIQQAVAVHRNPLVHGDLMETRSRLADATNRYNNAWRMSNELDNHRVILESQLNKDSSDGAEDVAPLFAPTLTNAAQNKKGTSGLSAALHDMVKQKIDIINMEIEESEEERKTAWKNMVNIKAEFEAISQRLPGEQIVANSTDFDKQHPLPELRSSFLVNMPPPMPFFNPTVAVPSFAPVEALASSSAVSHSQPTPLPNSNVGKVKTSNTKPIHPVPPPRFVPILPRPPPSPHVNGFIMANHLHALASRHGIVGPWLPPPAQNPAAVFRPNVTAENAQKKRCNVDGTVAPGFIMANHLHALASRHGISGPWLPPPAQPPAAVFRPNVIAENAQKKRRNMDGTVAPVSEPKQTNDGLYKKPAGRNRMGMTWDAVRGMWVPIEKSST